MLDAVAAVQRRCPLFLMPQRGRPHCWVTDGGIYLSRTSKSQDELENLTTDPDGPDSCWHGVVYFKAWVHRDRVEYYFLSGPRDRVLDYGAFVVYGDPELIQEVRAILASEGFQEHAAGTTPTSTSSSCAPAWTPTAAAGRSAPRGRRLGARSCKAPSPVACVSTLPTLRSEMTGDARIYTGRRWLGELLGERVLRYVRREFWW
jgi:hypothetical protein